MYFFTFRCPKLVCQSIILLFTCLIKHLSYADNGLSIFFASCISDNEVFTFQIDRGVKSPADISMDISRLIQILGFSPMKFEEGVRLTLTADATDATS